MSSPPVCSRIVSGNIFLNCMHFVEQGDQNRGHCHTYDHITMLSEGALEITCDGVVGRLEAPSLFLTPKDKTHKFVALADNTRATCIHALRDDAGAGVIIAASSPKDYAVKLVEGLTREPDRTPTLPTPDSQDRGAAPPAAIFDEPFLRVRAVSNNVEVKLFVLPSTGNPLLLQPTPYDQTVYLGKGSVNVACGGQERAFEAPYFLRIPPLSTMTITASSQEVVLANVHALRFEHSAADYLPETLSLEHCARRMQRVLEDIEQQTTVAAGQA